MESYRRADPVSFIDREPTCLSKSQQDLQNSAKELAGTAGVIDRPGWASELLGDHDQKLIEVWQAEEDVKSFVPVSG